ncbi:MAG: hypothetical protein IKV79_05145 [Oscillospiraceae bacterium]|nr:hypothetical protein [Oscillospiraceae bacterium]
MKKHFQTLTKAVRRGYAAKAKNLYLSVFLCFISGMFFGSMASSPLFQDVPYSDHSFRLWLDIGVIILTIFLSTSYLGFILIPAALFIRGFIFSAVLSSSILAVNSGLLRFIFGEAICAALFLPCYFILASKSISSSYRLNLGRSYGFVKDDFTLVRYIVYCIPLCAAEILYYKYLLPLFFI